VSFANNTVTAIAAALIVLAGTGSVRANGADPNSSPTDTTSPTENQPDSSINRTVLPSGMRIVVHSEPESPLIAVDVLVKVGSGQETDDTAGIGNFVAETLLASTQSRDPETIQEEINDLGGSVTVTRQPDWTEISALTIPDKFGDLMSLITDVLKEATFDPDVVENTRTSILTDIDAGDASVFDQAYNNMRSALFSDTGYGLPQLGTRRSITRMPRTQLLRYYYEYFIPKNMVVSVVGAVDPQLAVDTISSDMEDYDPFFRGSRRREPEQTPLPVLTEDVPPVRGYQTDLSEVCVMAGFRAPSMSSSDFPALQVLNALLGGMKTSRIFTILRDKQGLAYDLGSFYSPQLYAGDLTGYAFAAAQPLPVANTPAEAKQPASPNHGDSATTKVTDTSDVIATLRDQLLAQFASMQTTPPTAVELARAKHYLIGSYKIKHERIEDRASLLGIAELTSVQGAEMDEDYAKYINAVTIDDVVRVAKTYLVHPVISTIEPDPHNGGAVTE
jgi:zinc protease